jgi:peptidoglycan/LPS O-acetylase OafA/YrhL
MSAVNHHNNFNLLRFLFASLVIVSHAPELMDGNRSRELLTSLFGTVSFGELAVDGFFVLSGFLITKSWVSNPSWVQFMQSRVLRIVPGFVVACLISLLVLGPLGATAGYWQHIAWPEFFKGLLKLRLSGVPEVFAGSHYAMLNGALWTIPYEFKCYLAALVAGMVGVYARRWLVLAGFVALCLLHIGLKSQALSLSYQNEAHVRFAMAFAAGSVFFVYREVLTPNRWLQLGAAVALFVCMFFKPLAEPALCLMGGYLVLSYAYQGQRLLAFNRLPDVSYGVYLYAWPLNKLLLWYWPSVNVYLSMVLVFVASVVAGACSWYLVEKPSLRLKQMPLSWGALRRRGTTV